MAFVAGGVALPIEELGSGPCAVDDAALRRFYQAVAIRVVAPGEGRYQLDPVDVSPQPFGIPARLNIAPGPDQHQGIGIHRDAGIVLVDRLHGIKHPPLRCDLQVNPLCRPTVGCGWRSCPNRKLLDRRHG